MTHRFRSPLLTLACAASGVMLWLVGRQPSPQQPPSLRPILDRATEAKAAVDHVGQAFVQVSSKDEIALGQSLIERDREQIMPEGVSPARAREQAFLEDVLARLVKDGSPRRSDFLYRVQLVEHPSVNAFALPGGFLFVTTGMMDFAENEAELAAVLGHEMAHVDLRHCIERYQYEIKARKLGGEPLEAMAALGTRLMLQGYQDEQEAEADRWGMQIAARAGYHPQAGQRLFARLRDQWGGDVPPRTVRREAQHSIADAIEDLFASHPRPTLRISNLERALSETELDPIRDSYYLGTRNREALVSRSKQEYLEEFVRRKLFYGQ